MRALTTVGFMLIIAGVLLVIASFLMGAPPEGDVGGAGCIIIGPIPICFTGEGAATAVVLIGVVFMLVVFGIVAYIMWRMMRYTVPESVP